MTMMNLHAEIKSDTISKGQSFFDEGYACSQAVLLAFAGRFKLDERIAKLVSSAFGGGMGRLRQTCGAVTGGFMVIGLAYGNEQPNEVTGLIYEMLEQNNNQQDGILENN